jgi:hypothetical protein
MKKIYLVSVVFIVSILFFACTPQKQVAYQPTTPQPSVPSNNSLGQEIDVPCVYESMDDEEYFRELGTATSVNMQSARTAALQAAKDMIFQKLGGYVEGLSESYSRTVAGQSAQEKVQRLMEADMNQVVQQYVNNAMKTCEKMYDKGANGYTSFIAIQIPVKKMVEKMADVLSADEELQIEFNREQFRKYAEEKQKKMLENQKNNGR